MAIFKRKPVDVPRRRRSGNDGDSDTYSQRSAVFQRNRTLTGSTSNRISQSPQLSTDLESPRTHVHHLALKRRKVGTVFLGIVLVCAFLFWILTQFTARAGISFTGIPVTQKIDTTSYEKAINDYLGANPFARLRFTLDPLSLSNYVFQKLPEVAEVKQLGMGLIGETRFAITIRKPVAGWTLNNKQYFVDDKGVAFEQNYYGAPSVQIVDDSGISLQQGTAVASNRFLGFVGRVVSLSKSNGYIVTQAILPSNTTRQLEVYLEGVASIIRLSIDRPAGEQVEDMARAVRYLASQGQSPEYIDVRVSGKVFYK